MDPYKVLEVSKSATEEEIKKAYKTLSRRWHPDKNPNDREQADKKIKEINQAYGILGDPEKRAMYDRFGFDVVNRMDTNSSMPPDPFASFFQGFQGFHPFARHAQRDPLAQFYVLHHQITVQLADLYRGQTRSFSIKKRIKEENKPPVITSVTQKFTIIPGMEYGVKYQLQGQGHYLDQGRFGHLVIILVPDPDERSSFVRRESDLFYEITISLKQALLGFSIPIVHLDDRILLVESESVFIPEKRRVIKNQGFPMLPRNHHEQRNRRYGDLYIDFRIEVPNEIDQELSEKIKHLLPDTELDKKYRVKGDHTKYSVQKLTEEEPDDTTQNDQPHFDSDPNLECRTQ